MSVLTIEKVNKFCSVLKELKGEPYTARTTEDLASVLKGIASTNQCSSIVICGLPRALNDIAFAALSEFDCHSIDQVKGYEAVSVCEKADAGVTWAEFAIASQGALFEIAYDDGTKLASSLPLVSIVLLPLSHILEDLSEAMMKVKDILASSTTTTGIAVISLISGPSKTSDIELRLLYGVHGPNSLHVIILHWL